MSFDRPDGAGIVVRRVLAVLAAALVLLEVPPWHFVPADVGLESSWHLVIGYAAEHGWQWGRDILFTYGPLGYLRQPVFGDAPLVPALLWNALLVAATIASLLALLRPLPLRAATSLLAAILFAASMLFGKGLYVFLPLVAALLYFREPDAPPLAVITASIAASAVFAAAYTSTLPFAFAACVLIDASRVLRRRLPLCLPIFALAFVAALMLAGQSIGSIPPFLRSVAEFIAGYGDAMSSSGNGQETVAFVALSVAALALVVHSQWAQIARGPRRADALLLVLAFALFWFFTWKTGFVRHDLHSVVAWCGLAVGIAAYAGSRWLRLRAWSAGALLGVSIASSCAAVFAERSAFDLPAIGLQAKSAFVDVPAHSLREGLGALRDPAGWVAALRAANAQAQARIAATLPQLDARGSVDLIGYDQPVLLARGLDYRPLPVFHAYSAYTRWLIECNRSHLRSDRAPQTLFVSATTIDDRYPMQDAGQSIIELMQWYEPMDIAGDYVRMQRRAAPAAVAASDGAVIDAAFGQWVSVPEHGVAMLVRIDVQPNVAGRLARLALRLPALFVTARLADGSERKKRIVPAVAADGFLLSPYADGPVVLAALASGQLAQLDNVRVVAVRVDGEPGSPLELFRRRIGLQFVRFEPGAEDDEGLSPPLRVHFARSELVKRLAQSVAGKGQTVEAKGDLLFAHAPATPHVLLQRAGGVNVRYGILEGAWTGGNATDGVCFRVRAVHADGRSSVLHERCLTPVERVQDRGEQEAAIPLAASDTVDLIFETDCRGNCQWDWSYWKDIDLLPDARGPALLAPPSSYDGRAIVARLAQSVAGKGQTVEAQGARLFAHAPASPSISLPGARSLRVRYGISDGAWTDGRHTDGVCFRIRARAPDGASTTLHERCLAPLERAEDREEQQATVDLGATGALTLVFETDCRSNCLWDWSYWRDFEIVR